MSAKGLLLRLRRAKGLLTLRFVDRLRIANERLPALELAVAERNQFLDLLEQVAAADQQKLKVLQEQIQARLANTQERLVTMPRQRG